MLEMIFNKNKLHIFYFILKIKENNKKSVCFE